MQQVVDLSFMKTELPGIIAREQVGKLLGGVISSKRLANLDCLGEGPERMRIGRKVVYRTDQLLKWLESRSSIINNKEKSTVSMN